MSRHIIFVSVLGGFCLGFMKYELTKYYLYLKYRPLIEKYLDCMELFYLDKIKLEG